MLLHRHFEQTPEERANITTLRDVSPVKKPTEEGMDVTVHTAPTSNEETMPIGDSFNDEVGVTPQRRGRPRKG